MANLTITVDDKVLKRARIRALELGTSVNALLAEQLARFAGASDAQDAAIAALFALGDSPDDLARAVARGARRWTRDELHARG
jgi:hypothetical protein